MFAARASDGDADGFSGLILVLLKALGIVVAVNAALLTVSLLRMVPLLGSLVAWRDRLAARRSRPDE